MKKCLGSSRADVRERATNGSDKAVPSGTFDRTRKRAVRGLGLAPTSASGTEKDIPMTCLPVLVACLLRHGVIKGKCG